MEREQWWEGKITKRKSSPFLHQSHDIIPIFCRDSPYRSPLMLLVQPVVFVVLYALFLLYAGVYLLVLVCGMCVNCHRLI